MAIRPELPQLEALFQRHARGLFGLCYLHGGSPRKASALLCSLLCSLLATPRWWQRAQGSPAGLFRCAQAVCMEQYYKRPKRAKKAAPAPQPGPGLPFVMTDALRALRKLPPRYKTPLYLRLALGWGAEDTAAAIGGAPARADRLVRAGLKRARLTEGRAAQALSAIAPAEGGPQDVWDAFLVEQSEKGFAGRQRLRRFQRGMDSAIPYIALGVVALCVLAYQGVEHGWFNGQAYTPLPALESYAPLEGDLPLGAFTVFVPDPDSPEGLVQYLVDDAPQSLKELVRQMVALGGAPEGTALLEAAWGDSCGTAGVAIEPTARKLVLELSADAGAWFSAAAPQEQERMLLAMAKTVRAYYPDLEALQLVCQDGELTTAGGSTAQSLLEAAATVNRTAHAPYRP